MSDPSSQRELKPRSIALEILAGLALLAIAVTLASYAFRLHTSGKSFQALELSGIAVCCLGGSLDPVNWIWVCLPFTRNHVAEAGRFAGLGWVIIGLGWIIFVVGMIGKYTHA